MARIVAIGIDAPVSCRWFAVGILMIYVIVSEILVLPVIWPQSTSGLDCAFAQYCGIQLELRFLPGRIVTRHCSMVTGSLCQKPRR